MRSLRGAVLAGLLAAVLLTIGCAPAANPRLTVSPASAFFDRAVDVRMTGLSAGQQATLTMTTTSSDGGVWSSHATYSADSSGTVSAAQAPVAGDYRGARAMGLVEALQPTDSGHRYFTVSADAPWRLTITARIGGRTVGRATTTRELCPAAERSTRTTVAKDGVLGVLTQPLHPAAARQPAVVVFGGSEGGLGTGVQACLLAAHGYPSFAIAYFHAAGLPQGLERIPLETFVRAARLLAKQPHVDPQRIVLWGDSRGGEAALLTAAHFPSVVHAAIGSVPNWETAVGVPDPTQPAWTLGGKGIPTGTPIPVERIAGPILLVCGGMDRVWSSCSNAELVKGRIRQQHASNPVTLLDYPDAGHFVGSLVPDYPEVGTTGVVADGNTVDSGGTALGNNEARDDGWPRLLAWLAAMRRPSA